MTSSIVERIPTTDPNFEIPTGTLGCLLDNSNPGRAEMFKILRDDDFEMPQHRVICRAVREMHQAGLPVDAVLVADWIERHDLRERGADRGMLAVDLLDLAANAPVPAAGTWYAGLLVGLATRRRIRSAGRKLAELADVASMADMKNLLRAELDACAHLVNRAVAVAV